MPTAFPITAIHGEPGGTMPSLLTLKGLIHIALTTDQADR